MARLALPTRRAVSTRAQGGPLFGAARAQPAVRRHPAQLPGRGVLVQRAPSRPSPALAPPGAGAPLAVSQPGDRDEREADQIAQRVTRGPHSAPPSSAPAGGGGGGEVPGGRPPPHPPGTFL